MATEVKKSADGKRVSLVLGAGGARGLAHIGAIEVLEERGYRFAGIAGSSMGALIGGIHAAGRLREYRDWVCALERSNVLRLLDFSFGFPGLIRGERIIAAMRDLVGDHRIEDLSIPFTAVATDIQAQREVWINHGPLFDAIRASIAIPMIFTPHKIDGLELVDGGLLAPVPIAATRQVRSDLVIAVDVNGPPQHKPKASDKGNGRESKGADVSADVEAEEAEEAKSGEGYRARIAAFIESITAGFGDQRKHSPEEEKARPGLIDLMVRSLDTMEAQISRMQLALDPPELLIRMPRDRCAIYEFWRASELIELGRESTSAALDAYEAGTLSR
ncbi:MAG: patatin-like phospholipase family protein [Aquimonas sp.]|nr:patatin-like phospholipase family protein [Aquimonas sp.]